MNSLKGNIGYAEVFATYWMAYCMIASFSSVFLLANGYTNTEIGILIAIGNLVSVGIQPVVANMADRGQHANVFELSMVMAIFLVIAQGILLIIHGRSLVVFCIYLLMFAVHAAMQPLLNSMNATLAYRDILVDYGICRAIGSLGYAVMSAILSWMVLRYTELSLPMAGAMSSVLLVAGLFYLNGMFKRAAGGGDNSAGDAGTDRQQATDPAEQQDADFNREAPITMKDFVRRHRIFLVMTFGIFLIYYDHQIINFFMLQLFKNVGGGSTEMGTYYSIMTVLEVIPLFGFTWLTKHFSTSFLLKLATIGFVLRGVLMLVAGTPMLLLLTLVVHPIGFPLFLPTIVRYINEIMDTREAVRGQSMYVMVITVSGVVASSTGGIVLDSLGAGALLWICAITCVIGAVVILPLIEKAREE
jgi:PPP family 3-phenylpropionic acid transporter